MRLNGPILAILFVFIVIEGNDNALLLKNKKQASRAPFLRQDATIMDAIDRKILDILQADATVPVAMIADRVGLSAAPCWRRIKRMEDDGVIKRRVALVDRRKANVPMTLFVSVRTTRHAGQWLEDFRRVTSDIPEIVEAWRLTGEVDYLLRIVVPDIDTYDVVYKRLINRLEFADISSAIAMEELKYTTAIPTDYLLD
jgi:Lrp/AsnC family transcriptional regulator